MTQPVQDPIVKAILRTVHLFDLLDTPLTPLEMWKWLVAPEARIPFVPALKNDFQTKQGRPLVSFGKLLHVLHDDPFLAKQLEERDGYYALRGRAGELVAKRHGGSVRAISHWRVLRKWGRRFRSVPFLRLFAGCNFLAIDKVHGKSDLDVFLVAQKGRLWLVRFFLNAFALALGERITDQHRAEKLCLSFNVADGPALDLRVHAFAPWVPLVRSVLDRGIFERFLTTIAAWTNALLPHAALLPADPLLWQAPVSRWRESVRRVLELILGGRVGDLLEAGVRALQLRHLRRTGRGESRGGLVVSDLVLKLHEQDIREPFYTRLAERYRSEGLLASSDSLSLHANDLVRVPA